MSFAQRFRTSFLTDTTSTATAVIPTSTQGGVINGQIEAVIYYRDGTAPPTSTARILITVEATSQTIASCSGAITNASFEIHPRAQLHTTAGTTIAQTSHDRIAVANSRLVVTVDGSAGAAKVGTIDVIVV